MRLIALLLLFAATPALAQSGLGFIDGSVETDADGAIVYEDTGDVAVEQTTVEFGSSIETDQGFASVAGSITVGGGTTGVAISATTDGVAGLFIIDLVFEVPEDTTFTRTGNMSFFPGGDNPGTVTGSFSGSVTAGTFRMTASGIGPALMDLTFDGEFAIPPVASDLDVTVFPVQSTEISLPVDPMTSAPLTYRVTSLPDHGVLAENGVEVADVPFEFDSGVLDYTPEPGFSGNDGFGFDAIGTNGFASNSARIGLIVPRSASEVLRPSDVGTDDAFGADIAIEGDLVLVSSVGDDDSGDGAGAGYLFDLSSGAELRKLLPPPGSPLYFGASVQLDDQFALIGASGISTEVGAAYLINHSTGTLERAYVPDDGAAGDLFGATLDLTDDLVLVGAAFHDSFAGAAYLFDRASGTQLAKIQPPDGNPSELFARSVALAGQTAIIGAPRHDPANTTGAAYVYDLSMPVSPVMIRKLRPPTLVEGDRFGFTVAIDGTTAVVGAYRADDAAGAAYLFSLSSETPGDLLLPPDRIAGSEFGVAVTIDSGKALIGAWKTSFGPQRGIAYLFDTATCSNVATLVPSEASDFFGLGVAVEGDAGVVGAILDDVGGFQAGAAWTFDVSLPPACPADVTTTGAAEGDADFGKSDGVTNLSDLLYFVNIWQDDLNGPPGSPADVTTSGAVEGDPAFGQPDGLVNLSDLLHFVNRWLDGRTACP